MKTLNGRSLLMATSILAMPVLSAPAFAQQASGGIPEIVVTAQRQSQNVLSVPMSIQAISGESLQKQNIKSITDLQFATPGYVSATSAGYTQIFLRGIGNSIFVGADPSVASYIDDVPHIYGSMLDSLADVERVEVLKGAQGGLYGRNATGGVVNLITKQPNTEKFEGDATVSYGEKNTLRLAGYVNVPLSDNVAVNYAIERDKHDGYVKNVEPANPFTAAMFPGGSRVGNAQQTADFMNSATSVPQIKNGNFWATDGKILLKASDNLKVTLQADYGNKHDDDGGDFSNTSPTFAQAALAGNLSIPAAFGGLGATPNFPAGFVLGNLGKYTSANSQFHNVYNLDTGASGTIDWTGPGFDLKSISAYRMNRTYLDTELSGSAPSVGQALVQIHRRYFYQELRAVSTGEGPFHWLGGATYLKTHFYGNTVFALAPPAGPFIPLGSTIDQIKNWTAYAQAGYDFTSAINLTVSGRYVHEHNNATYGGIPGAYNSVEKHFLPSATVSYKFEEGGNAYARWARGFKAGGINPVSPPVVFPDPTTEGGIFKGEQVDTYEVGYRAPLMDHRMNVTSAVYYNNYKNLQVAAHTYPQYAAIIEAIINAGTARTYGMEASVDYKVSDSLTVGIAGGYLNAKYKNFSVPATNPVIEPFNLNGRTMANAPKFQLALTADYDQPLNDKIRLVGNVLESHISSQLFIQSGDPGVLPDVVGPGYWITNLRIGVKTTDDRYSIYAYANNLFNAQYYTYGSSSASDGNLLSYGKPRIIGGEINVKF